MGAPSGLAWQTFRGRNGWEHPAAVPDDMGTEALNVVFVDGGLAERRPGAQLIPVTGDAFTGIAAAEKNVPPSGLADANLLIVSNDVPPKILAFDTAFVGTSLTLKDAITGSPADVTSCQLNGKQFLAYQSGHNRLHVWDPLNGPTVVRRTGLPPAGAPSVADHGSGTYAATLRYYRVSWQVIAGGVTLRQGELGPDTAFTPSGSGLSARVTKPTASGEGETHWTVWGSLDNETYYFLTQLAVATTVYDDTAAPSTYSLGAASPIEGSFLDFPSVKFLLSDGTRMYGLGVFETTDVDGTSLAPVPGRLYYTPVLGSTGDGDDERIESTVDTEGWIDLTPGGAGAEDRGLGGPINGEIFAFQSKGIFRLIPTGQAQVPLARVHVSPHVGALSHKSIVLAEDETGAPAIYFLNPEDGPRRIGAGGAMQWLGRDVNDLWQRVNQDAATVKAWGLFDGANKRVLWFISVDGSDTPTLIFMFDVTKGESQGFIVRKGWAQWTGNAATWEAGVMFPSDGGNDEGPTGGLDVLARIDATRTHDYGYFNGPAGYRQAVGTITGTSAPQTIDVGFPPTAVLIQPIDSSTIVGSTDKTGAIWTADMGAAALKLSAQSAALVAALVTATPTGFTVSADDAVNKAGLTYSYLAVGDTVGNTFRTGTYAGNNTDNRSIAVGAAGFAPTVVYLFGGGTGGGMVRDDNMVGDFSMYQGTGDSQSNGIQQFQANGFQVGTDTRVNGLAKTYYYLAWQHDVGGLLAKVALKRGVLTGTGAIAPVTVGFGARPIYVTVIGDAGSTQFPVWRQAVQSSTASTRWTDGTSVSTGIISIDSDGFTVAANLSQSGIAAYWHAFGAGRIAVDDP